MDTTDLRAAAGQPTTDWLETCFGPGTIWRPSPDDLPEGLGDPAARAFLTEVGIPAVRLGFVDYDSADLPADGMWEEDPDELFGLRHPDDDSPPASFAYGIGRLHQLHLMLRGDTGTVEVYDPDGWDHAAGHRGRAADALPRLVGALGVLARFEERLEVDAADAYAELTALLTGLGQGPGDSSFWAQVVEDLADAYGLA